MGTHGSGGVAGKYLVDLVPVPEMSTTLSAGAISSSCQSGWRNVFAFLIAVPHYAAIVVKPLSGWQ
ncbi:hypothetical protein CAP48_15350 [Advenella sp. S44]|nr:hypothetical protein CAP48_15350 [Advenella sp. S44]